MPMFRFCAAVLMITMLGGQGAWAFSIDTTAGTNSDGSSRYADPDDQAEARFGLSDSQNHDQSDVPPDGAMNPTSAAPAFVMHAHGTQGLTQTTNQ